MDARDRLGFGQEGVKFSVVHFGLIHQFCESVKEPFPLSAMALGQATETFEALHGLSHQLPFPRLPGNCSLWEQLWCGCPGQSRSGRPPTTAGCVIPPAPIPCFSNPFHFRVVASLLN